jgi:glycosyltransferase involved in cell wall biosynthesis
MTDPKVSIIIPVHNTELYLRQCLDSIVNQTLNEIEIICVNDGSTDGSLNILNEYAARDKRIRVIDKENGGQGLARNIAIKHASGEYLGFVDSDDWVDSNMFMELWASAKKFEADVTICEFSHFNQDTGRISQPEWLKLPVDTKFDNTSFNWEDIREIGFQINSGPVNKIYRSDFINRFNIEFSKGIYYQDIIFVYASILNAKKISLVRKPLYLYRYARQGSTTSDKGKKQFDIFIALSQLQDVVERIQNIEKLNIDFTEFKFRQYLYHFNEVRLRYKKEFWIRIKSEYNELDKETRDTAFKKIPAIKFGIEHGFLGYKFYEPLMMGNNFLFRYIIIGRFKALLKKLLK